MNECIHYKKISGGIEEICFCYEIESTYKKLVSFNLPVNVTRPEDES